MSKITDLFYKVLYNVRSNTGESGTIPVNLLKCIEEEKTRNKYLEEIKITYHESSKMVIKIFFYFISFFILVDIFFIEGFNTLGDFLVKNYGYLLFIFIGFAFLIEADKSYIIVNNYSITKHSFFFKNKKFLWKEISSVQFIGVEKTSIYSGYRHIDIPLYSKNASTMLKFIRCNLGKETYINDLESNLVYSSLFVYMKDL